MENEMRRGIEDDNDLSWFSFSVWLKVHHSNEAASSTKPHIFDMTIILTYEANCLLFYYLRARGNLKKKA